MSRCPTVKDRTKAEHVGAVRRTIFSDPNPDRPFSLLALADDHVVAVNATHEAFAPGTVYRFMGQWEETAKGPRFRASTFIVHGFGSRIAVERYLAENCRGIGQASAGKLWAAYGSDAVRMLREQPGEVSRDGLLPDDVAEDAARDLARQKAGELTKIDLTGLLRGRGFPSKMLDNTLSKWKARAPEIIRRDPYRLLTEGFSGASWARCDKMFLEFHPARRNSIKRAALAGWAAVREDRTGSTWVDAGDVVRSVRDAVPLADPVRALRVAIRAGRLRMRAEDDGRKPRQWLAIADRGRDEQRIADALARLAAGPNDWPDLPEASAVEGDGLPSAHQVGQLGEATAGPVGCFTGGPGTGKTYTLAHLIRSIIDRHGPDAVAVCAPTGMAAKRATDALRSVGLPIRATTIHRLLGVVRKPSGGLGFEHGRQNPTSRRFVFVDESSMIDASLLADLLDALAPPLTIEPTEEVRYAAGERIMPKCRRCNRTLTNPDSWAIGYGTECREWVPVEAYAPVAPIEVGGEVVIPARAGKTIAGAHVLFVGDIGQLPPVGHGSPLRDLIASGTVGVGELTEVRRNAGAIVRACKAIREGRPIEVPAEFDIDAPDPANLFLVPARGPAAILAAVEDTLTNMRRFNPVWDCQVITPLNEKSEVSRKALNARLAGLLNPHGRRIPGCPFAVGDKVICLKNSKITAVVPSGAFGRPEMEEDAGYYHDDDTKPDGEVVVNGDIGRVVALSDRQCVVSFGADRLVRIPVFKAKNDDDAPPGDDATDKGGLMGDFDLAYAITVHKSQGSEWPVVLAVIDPNGGAVADASFWYTAISRGRRAVGLVGSPKDLEAQRRRKSLVRRKTFLAELLKGDMK
jgi:hypothetical protein